MTNVKIHFSDFFEVSPKDLENYGAFNISLIRDLPLFIDPFLLFNSDNVTYHQLHEEIIRYLKFLRDEARDGQIDKGLLGAWFNFPEVSQNWLGFSKTGNSGRGLGNDFAKSLHRNFYVLFTDFGDEQVTRGTHLEKLTLIKSGVGKDMISDFTTNLIKGYLLEYTESFTKKYIGEAYSKEVNVDKVRFNYHTKSWEWDIFLLPWHNDDYVLLTPINILTRLSTWINRRDLIENFEHIATTIPNSQLRAQIDNYFQQVLSPEPFKKVTKKDREEAIEVLLIRHPEIFDYYIKNKEDNGDRAILLSEERVERANTLYVNQISYYSNSLAEVTDFYKILGNTYIETHEKIAYLKSFIEDKGGHKLFFIDGIPVRKEEDVQRLFKLVWYGSPSVASSEVNDGRGPADFKISRGSSDVTIAEFKLASNTQLERNLKNQAEIYEKASDATNKTIKVIVFFDAKQEVRVKKILKKLGLYGNTDIVLIDARADNKPSGSKA